MFKVWLVKKALTGKKGAILFIALDKRTIEAVLWREGQVVLQAVSVAGNLGEAWGFCLRLALCLDSHGTRYPSTAVTGFILLECSSHSLPQLTGGREMNDFSCMGEFHATQFFCSLDPWSQAGKADGMMCILLVRGFLFFFIMNKIMKNIFILYVLIYLFYFFIRLLLSIQICINKILF